MSSLTLSGDLSQQRLIWASKAPSSNASAKRANEHLRRVARDNGVDKALEENDLDLLAFPMDSWALQIAAAAGEPRVASAMSYFTNVFRLSHCHNASRSVRLQRPAICTWHHGSGRSRGLDVPVHECFRAPLSSTTSSDATAGSD